MTHPIQEQPDARARMNRLMAARTEVRSQADDRIKEFMAMEYAYITQAFIANEEMGEKRVSLFTTLTTGLGAAALVAANKLGPSSPTERLVISAIGLAWLVLGYLTFVRVVHRNKTTDEYKDALQRLRAWYLKPEDSEALRAIPFNPYGPSRPRRTFRFWVGNGGRGGYAEVIAFVNSVIVGGLTYQILGARLQPVAKLIVAFLLVMVSWWLHGRLAHRTYAGK